MFGIKLYQYVYVPCESLQTYEQILGFFKKDNFFKTNSNLQDVIQYNEKFNFITFTMNREFQISFPEYILYLRRKKEIDGKHIAQFFENFTKKIDEYKILSIGQFDVEKIWITVNESKKIEQLYYLNLVPGQDKQKQNFSKIYSQAIQSLGKLQEKQRSLLESTFPISFSVIKKAKELNTQRIQLKQKNQLKEFLQEEQKKINNGSFNDKPLRVTILNIALQEQLQNDSNFNFEAFQKLFQEVSKCYHEKWKIIKDFLFTLLSQYQIKCQKLESIDKFKKFLRDSIQNTSQLHQAPQYENLDYLLIKLMQKYDAMNDIFYSEKQIKPKEIIISYFQNRIKDIVIQKLNEQGKLSNLVQYMALLRQNDDEQQIEQHFQQIFIDMTKELKIDSIPLYTKQIKIFTDEEIENQLVELQKSKILLDTLYPDLISSGIFIDYFKSSQFYIQRRQLFLEVLSILENTLNRPSFELAETLSIMLLESLKEKITDESKLLNELLTKTIKHYLSVMITLDN